MNLIDTLQDMKERSDAYMYSSGAFSLGAAEMHESAEIDAIETVRAMQEALRELVRFSDNGWPATAKELWAAREALRRAEGDAG